ncbi:MAG TPA: ABC transporter substrate-binding protein [Burkholderiales bacterium]|jgi:ABC-type branched-subunit amino acid transport system substrate-binding protein
MIERRRFVAAAALSPLIATAGMRRAHAAAEPILVGQSAALTGPQAAFGVEMNAGIKLYFSRVNAGEGIAGRKVELIAEDDQGREEMTANKTQVLIGRGAQALIGYTTRPCSVAGAGLADKAGIPFIAPFSGTPALYKNYRTTFTVRASYDEELQAIMDYFTTVGQDEIAFVYLNDAKSTNLPLVEAILKKKNLALKGHAGVDRTSADTKATVEAIAKVQPQAVAMLANNLPAASFIRGFREKMPGVPIAIVSFVDAEQLIRTLGPVASGVMFSQVVPPPTRRSRMVVEEFRKAWDRTYPQRTPSFTALEGYIGARALTEALKHTGPKAAPSNIVSGLEAVDAIDLGSHVIGYSHQRHNGSHYVNMMAAARSGGFVD